MTKVHPNASSLVGSHAPRVSSEAGSSCRKASPRGEMAVLTVWRKSLLFNGNGFTVFNSKGNLVYRVDNYSSPASRGEIVLMDAAGRPLLTFRRKKLSLGDQWLIYNGEEAVNPRFAVKKGVNILSSSALAHVSPCPSGGKKACLGYTIVGSYSQRNCSIVDQSQQRLAEIKRKDAVGGVTFGIDVFRLIVEPELDESIAMAIVILLEQMFGSRGVLLLKG